MALSQGSSRSSVTTTPSLTVANGGFGFINHSVQLPFVTGFIPEVNGRPISLQGNCYWAPFAGIKVAKPVQCFEVAVALAPRGGVVWDPCAGTGASLEAAHRAGRVWRGAELDPERCKVIVERWRALEAGGPIEPVQRAQSELFR